MNVLQKILNYKNKSQSFENAVQCERVSIENCSELEDFNKCKACSPGYFLKEDKTCQQYPKKKIINCKIYTSNTNCQQCHQGFFRASSTECKQITSVEFCLVYSQTSTTTACTKCNDDYYLSSSTSCLPRDLSALSKISDCSNKDPNVDKCLKCNLGFVLSSNGIECANSVANCLNHNIFSSGNPPICQTCINGYLLSGSECIPGNDPNCEIFFNSGSCQSCKHKFFHDGTNTCFEHQSISDCKTYAKTFKNTCQECEGNNFNFDLIKKCKLLSEIPNCATYNHDVNTANVASCATCKSGYFLDTSVCNVINVANCDKGNSSSICTDCLPGFVKFTVNSTVECKPPHEFMTEYCETIDNTGGNTYGLKDVSCSNCKINALPIDYENNYACISNDLLKDENSTNITDANLISGCLKYDVTGANPTCTLCEEGKYIAFNRKSCVTDCGDGIGYSAMTIGTNSGKFVEFYNICQANGSDNDFIKAPSKEDFTPIIIKCASNMFTAISDYDLYSLKDSSNVSLDGEYGNYIQNIGTLNPEVECLSLNTKTIKGANSFMENCEYYVDLDGTDYGCNKCTHGFHGKPVVNGKYIESCHIMESCDGNVKYNNLEANLSVFFSCHKCKNPNKIPYIFYEWTNNDITDMKFTVWIQYTLKENTNFKGINDNHSIECIDNISSETFLSDIGSNSTNTINLIENCGLGLFNIKDDIKSNVTSVGIANVLPTNSSYLCAACKPGYKPQVRQRGFETITSPSVYILLNMALGSCDLITNCSNSTWFNACSQCDPGYVYKFGDLNLIKNDSSYEDIPNTYFMTNVLNIKIMKNVLLLMELMESVLCVEKDLF